MQTRLERLADEHEKLKTELVQVRAMLRLVEDEIAEELLCDIRKPPEN